MMITAIKRFSLIPFTRGQMSKVVFMDYPWVIPVALVGFIVRRVITHDQLGVLAAVITLIGEMMNTIVIRANGGLMPVVNYFPEGRLWRFRIYPSKLHLNINIGACSDPTASSDAHCPCTEKTRFAGLCDRIFIPGTGIWSIGDLVMVGGALVAVWRAWVTGSIL